MGIWIMITNILHINIRSIYSNYDELDFIVNSFTTDDGNKPIICLTETWVHKDDNITVYTLQGYQKPMCF